MKFVFYILIIVSFGFSSTLQRRDLLIVENEIYKINTYPLVELQKSDSLFDKHLSGFSARTKSTENDSLSIVLVSSGCWREFWCSWIVKNDKLYLESITNCANGKAVPLNAVFNPTQIQRNLVFAN